MDFVISEDCIGVGTYGTVYTGYCKKTGAQVVYKKCTYPHGAKVIVQNEVSALEKLADSDYVVKMLWHDDHGIVLPRYRRNLADYIREGFELSRNDIIHIIRRIALAIRDNNSKGIIHRDIKPDNILLNQPDDAVLADYGIYCIDDPADKDTDVVWDKSFYVGTMHWRAPEILAAIDKEISIEYDHRIDIWSLGLTLMLMIFGDIPANDTKTNEETLIATELNLPILLEFISADDPKFGSLLCGMLKMDQKERFTVDQVLNHPALLFDSTPSSISCSQVAITPKASAVAC